MTAVDSSGSTRERTWPRNARVQHSATVAARCANCKLTWRVHRDLAGFRLRCDCDAWVPVPPIAHRGQPALGAARAAATAGEPPILTPGTGAAVAPPVADELDAPSPRLFGTLCLAALAVAPWFLLGEAADGELAVYRPWAALAGALVALVFGFGAWPANVPEPIRVPRARHVIEALVVAYGAFFLVAQSGMGSGVWPAAPAELLGTGWAIFLCAFGPAVFEELAFRGLIQGRATEYLGRFFGVVATALVFGFAHGLGPALPAVVGAGLYLGWLRERSESLVPGMLARFGFQSGLVLGWIVG